jgi:hypothetical protein
MRSANNFALKSRPIAYSALIALVISLIPLSAFSAQKVAAGTQCKSLNAKAIVKNMTYTCIKKGSKLVWNKGVPTKAAAPSNSPNSSATSSPSPTPTSMALDLLGLDSRISSTSLLSSISSCKTIDKTVDQSRDGAIHRNGFPRPKEAIYPSGKAKVLVIPFQYDSWLFTTTVPALTNRTVSDLDALKKVNKEVEDLVKKLSGNNFELEITVAPESEWLVLDPKESFSAAPLTDNFAPIKRMIAQNDGKIDFEKYDSYVFISALQAPIPSMAQATYSTDVKTSKGTAKKLVLMSTYWTNANIYFHELGHSMFGLEDLYLFKTDAVDWLPSDLKVILSWDLMANAELQALTNWNRLLMGWLPDSDVRCLTDQAQTTHYLSDISIRNQPKVVLINIEPGVTLAAEPRLWGDTNSLLVYLIDTNIGHGEGPLRSLNTLIPAGESREVFDWKFNVLKSNKDGLLFEVSKGTGKKYVAPPPRFSQNQGGSTDRPYPRSGNLTQTTYLKARADWDVTNYRSYRIFVTPHDDPKKILFDTGIVNDSRNPLVVEISGLICGVELVTTSQFWTERDGKGGLAEASSGQLRKFECK